MLEEHHTPSKLLLEAFNPEFYVLTTIGALFEIYFSPLLEMLLTCHQHVLMSARCCKILPTFSCVASSTFWRISYVGLTRQWPGEENYWHFSFSIAFLDSLGPEEYIARKKEKIMFGNTFFCPEVWYFLSFFSICPDMLCIGEGVPKFWDVVTFNNSN